MLSTPQQLTGDTLPRVAPDMFGNAREGDCQKPLAGQGVDRESQLSREPLKDRTNLGSLLLSAA